MNSDEAIERLTHTVPTPDLMHQVQVARAFKRDMATFTERATRMATADRETAEACFYTLKRTDKRTGEVKKIQGPSIRLAEICTYCFGNLRWGGRTVGEDDRHVILQGVAHDLENNLLCNVEVRRRITTREGSRYSDDMITVAQMAGIAICMRNAAFKVIPASLWRPVYEAAMAKAVGDASTLSDRRQKMVAQFAKMGVGIEKILGYCEKRSIEEITLEDLTDLIGAFNAIREGEHSVDEVFGKRGVVEMPRSKAETETVAEGPGEERTPPTQDSPSDMPTPPSPLPPPASGAVDRRRVWAQILHVAKGSGQRAPALLQQLAGRPVSGLAELSDEQVAALAKKLWL